MSEIQAIVTVCTLGLFIESDKMYALTDTALETRYRENDRLHKTDEAFGFKDAVCILFHPEGSITFPLTTVQANAIAIELCITCTEDGLTPLPDGKLMWNRFPPEDPRENGNGFLIVEDGSVQHDE